MPTIRIDLFEGRTDQQKADLAREITKACAKIIGSSPESVDILFFDIAKNNWATGGVLWSEKSATKPAS